MLIGNCIVYAKYKGVSSFHAFSMEEGCCVKNIINASTVDNCKAVRDNLQRTADMNKEMDVVFQLRTTFLDGSRKVVFQTN